MEANKSDHIYRVALANQARTVKESKRTPEENLHSLSYYFRQYSEVNKTIFLTLTRLL